MLLLLLCERHELAQVADVLPLEAQAGATGRCGLSAMVQQAV